MKKLIILLITTIIFTILEYCVVVLIMPLHPYRACLISIILGAFIMIIIDLTNRYYE